MKAEESVRESVGQCTLVSGTARPLQELWIRCERLEGWNQRRNALFFFFTTVLKQSETCNVAFSHHKKHFWFLHDTKFFVVTGICNVSFSCNVFFFSVTLTLMLSCSFLSVFHCFGFFHSLHCGVIDTVCLYLCHIRFYQGKIWFVWLLKSKMMHICTHITAGNIAFPAKYILFFLILEMHVIDKMFNKIAFTGQRLVHFSHYYVVVWGVHWELFKSDVVSLEQLLNVLGNLCKK